MGILITGVDGPSKGYVEVGEHLAEINGKKVLDVLDYMHLSQARGPTLTMANGRRVTVPKPAYDDLGLTFESFLMDAQRSCANRCVFCFIDQLPPGMRETLYFKDDDARLSFLMGNYISMTNLSERDVARMVDYRVSPINISVHTTNPSLRAMMLGNQRGADSLAALRRFAGAGLSLNCQIVVCAGLNDGEELSSTLQDLLELLPALDSVAVVPAGLTRYREGLYPLRPLTKEEAEDVLGRVLAAGDSVIAAEGRRVVYPSDELFLQAGRDIPDGTFYDDYPQYENGVGMLAMLREEFETLLDGICPPAKLRRVTGVTGAAACPTVAELFEKVQGHCEGRLEARLVKIENRFFGPNITVAGLVTGQDIISQLKGIDVGDALLVPSVMLRYERDRFLDDVTVKELEQAVGAPVIIFEPDAAGLIKALTGEEI
ncbi:MAG TPA: DUF512 domain-containing protein [Terriglobales bacterium]|nr:DUF512 domain-containing protein [Terriglobales bacterium]